MRIGLSGLMLFFVLALAATAAQAAEPVPAVAESAFPAGRGNFDIRLEHLKETTSLRTESLEKLIERQDERIADLQWETGKFSIIVTIFGLLIAFAAVVSYFSARGKALDAVKDWMDDHESRILERLEKQALEKIEPRIDKLEQEAQGKIDTHIQEGVKKIGALLESATEKRGQINEILKRARVSFQEPRKAEISEDDKEEIDRAAKEIEAKPESERTYRDWEVRALSTDASGDYLIAAENFNNAAHVKGIPLVQNATALVNKGVALAKSGDYEAAVVAGDDVLRRFGGAKEPALRERVAMALNGKSYARLLLAKQAWQSPGKEDEARALLSTALADAEAALEIAPDNPIILGNKGYVIFLLGREDDAESVLRRALELGGEKIRDGELEDAGKYPLPQDEEFKNLINSLWDEVSKD